MKSYSRTCSRAGSSTIVYATDLVTGAKKTSRYRLVLRVIGVLRHIKKLTTKLTYWESGDTTN